MSELNTENAIKDWAATVRHGHFSSRKEFNFEVCARLMAAGLPPTPALVLRVGCWGQTNYVAEDVSAWYAALGETLRARDAEIPIGSRRKGNQLLEELWATAVKEVEVNLAGPLQSKLDQVLQELATSKAALAKLNEELVSYRDENDALNRSIAIKTEECAALNEQARQLHESHAAQLGETMDAHANQLSQLRVQHDAKGLALQEALNQQTNFVQAETRRLLLAIDGSRQETSKALATVAALKEELFSLRIEFAKRDALVVPAPAENRFRSVKGDPSKRVRIKHIRR